MPPKSPDVSVLRPVWRSFRASYIENAVKHVKAGGLAAVFFQNGDIKMLLPRKRDGALTEMSLWVLLALDLRRWGSSKVGPAKGLACVRVRDDDREIIREWCERDGRHPTSRVLVTLNCLACGACCRDNRVVLEKADFARWGKADRDDLAGPRYVKRSKGERILILAKSGRCQHLLADNKCEIYKLRPDNCSVFPVASEPCLSAREETLGIVD